MVLLRLLIDRGELGVSEAAATLGVAPSTVHRLLATMADHGFVERASDRRYRPGSALAGPRGGARRIANLVGVLHPVLQQLYDEIGETVHLMVLIGSDVQFVDGVEGTQALRIGLRIGSRLPAYCTSGGKAMLAQFDDETVSAMHPQGLRPWPGSRLRSVAELQGELAQVRLSGVGINTGESEDGVRALGVAVGRDPSQPLAAITVSLPAERFRNVDQNALAKRLLTARDAANAVL
ncbi:IclR family transcriptional regulator [Gryllotalpicola daejeonensis]|uniref:IclR family transcriptional regulator n=2 Tax=Gryllotalpicola daejeonensis TaxID=993087 RepID=A0ABP7ZN18_9MICO